ncbi:hypothetical protein GH714_009967 [Hevea brasiliensis]|uniref:Uncharacterized protein n=1 Tax=Hevea brasiliensis TaxID=3981 RepID=A0A6A6LPA1_HEVBR|nr:hypothetical protein GH714_009967 [Hevea brasiliensis]
MGSNDHMEATVTAATTTDATLNSQDGDLQEISINVNHLYLDIVDGEEAARVRTAVVIDLVADERIRVLEEKIMRMRENQEGILQQRVKEEVSCLKHRVKSSFALCKRR